MLASWRPLLLGLLIVHSTPRDALAQTPAPAGAGAAEETSPAARAVELGKRGRVHFEQGDWAAARNAFTEAESLVHSPVFVLFAARSRARLGDVDGAKVLYRQLLNEELPASAPPQWHSAKLDASVELARLTNVPAQETVTAAPAPTAPSGDPTAPADPAPRFTKAPAPSSPDVPWAGIAVTGLGAATVGAGLVVGAVALGQSATARDACEQRREGSRGAPCDDLAADHEEATTMAHVATGLLVGGAAIAVGGVILWLVGSDQEARAVTAVASRGGLGLGGRF